MAEEDKDPENPDGSGGNDAGSGEGDLPSDFIRELHPLTAFALICNAHIEAFLLFLKYGH